MQSAKHSRTQIPAVFRSTFRRATIFHIFPSDELTRVGTEVWLSIVFFCYGKTHCGFTIDDRALDKAVSAAALAGHLAACERLLYSHEGEEGANDVAGGSAAAAGEGGASAAGAAGRGASARYRWPPELAVDNAASSGHLPVLQLLLEAGSTNSTSELERQARQQRLSLAAQAACRGGKMEVLQWLQRQYGHKVGFAEVEAAAKAGQVELMEGLMRPRQRTTTMTRLPPAGDEVAAGGGGGGGTAAGPRQQRAAALHAALQEGLAAAGLAAAGVELRPADAAAVGSSVDGAAVGSSVDGAVPGETVVAVGSGAAAAAAAGGPAQPDAAAAAVVAALAAALGAARSSGGGGGRRHQRHAAAAAAGLAGGAPSPSSSLRLSTRQQLELLCALASGCPLPVLRRHWDDLWVPYAAATAGDAAWVAAGRELPMLLWPAATALLAAAATSPTADWEDKWHWLLALSGPHEPGGDGLLDRMLLPGPQSRSGALEAACARLPDYCRRLRVLHAAGMRPSPEAVEGAVWGGHADALAYLWDEAHVACRLGQAAFQALVMSRSRGSVPVLRLLQLRGMAFTAAHVRLAAQRDDWPLDSLLWLLAQVPQRRQQRQEQEHGGGGGGAAGGGGGGGSSSSISQPVWSAAFAHAAHQGHGVVLLLPLVARGAAISLAAVAEGGSERTLAWAVQRLTEDQDGRPPAILHGEDARRVLQSGNLAAIAWLEARQLLSTAPVGRTPDVDDLPA